MNSFITFPTQKTVKKNAPCENLTIDEILGKMRSEACTRICAAIHTASEHLEKGEIDNARFKEIYEPLKSNLPVVYFHASRFKDNHRSNANAVPSGLYILDIDHLENPREFYERAIRGHEAEWGIQISHVTASEKGLRLVCGLPQGMGIPEAQAWLARQIGVVHDSCTKDLARASFLPWDKSLIYMDLEALRTGNWAHPRVPADNLPAETQAADVENESPARQTATTAFPDNFKGILFKDIVRELWARMGGEPQEGERNTKLHKMACHLRAITDNSEDWLLQVLPSYGLPPDEMRRLVHSACGQAYAYRTRLLNASLRALGEAQEGEGLVQLPPLPATLPPLLKLLTSCTPAEYRAVVADAVFPALAAQLGDTKFQYVDGTYHRPCFLHGTVGKSGSGKSCIIAPIDQIMADIDRQDEVNREREDKWRKEFNRRAASKERPAYPENCIIRHIDLNCTSAAFLQRMQQAQPYGLYARANEVEQLGHLNDRGNRDEQFNRIRQAFDDDRMGAERSGAPSVSGRTPMRFNLNFSTTPAKFQSYFARQVTTGTVQRLNVSVLPSGAIGGEIPRFKPFPQDFEEQLKVYTQRLDVHRGNLVCRPLLRFIEQLRAELAEVYQATADAVRDDLSHRALLIGAMKGFLLWLSHGEKWMRTFEDFIRWSVQCDIENKMRFFGQILAQAEEEDTRFVGPRKHGPRSLLDELPDTFTRGEFIQFYTARGKTSKQASTMLRQWKSRREIEQLADGRYAKA